MEHKLICICAGVHITASKMAPPIIMHVCIKSVQRTVVSPPANVQVEKKRNQQQKTLIIYKLTKPKNENR